MCRCKLFLEQILPWVGVVLPVLFFKNVQEYLLLNRYKKGPDVSE